MLDWWLHVAISKNLGSIETGIANHHYWHHFCSKCPGVLPPFPSHTRRLVTWASLSSHRYDQTAIGRWFSHGSHWIKSLSTMLTGGWPHYGNPKNDAKKNKVSLNWIWLASPIYLHLFTIFPAKLAMCETRWQPKLWHAYEMYANISSIPMISYMNFMHAVAAT